MSSRWRCPEAPDQTKRTRLRPSLRRVPSFVKSYWYYPSRGLSIYYPTSEETFSAGEFALEWFEAWDQHADHEHDFGGEHAVMRRLRRAVWLAREGD